MTRKLISILTLLGLITSGCAGPWSRAQQVDTEATARAVQAANATAIAQSNSSTTSTTPTSTEQARAATAAATPAITTTWSPPSAASTAVVNDQGFELNLGRVRVSAPAGVAEPGTEVTVSTPPGPAPSEVDKFSSLVGNPVRVVLGTGQQPKQPVRIVFDLAGTELGAKVSEEAPLAVMSRSEETGAVEPLVGTWDAEAQTLTVVTDHLSLFWPFQLDVSKLFKPVVDIVDHGIGVRYPSPDCFGKPLTVGTVTYTVDAVPNEVVWPCLAEDNSRITLELHSNSGLAWRARTAPSTSGAVSGTFSSSGLLTAAVYNQLFARYAHKESVVVPGASTSFGFNPANPPRQVSVRADVGLYLVASLVWGVESALGLFKIDVRLLDDIATLNCVTALVKTTMEIEFQNDLRSFLSSTLNCLQLALQKIGSNFAAFLLAAFTSGVALLVAGVQGAIGEVTGANTAQFAISHRQASRVIASPTSDHEGVNTALFPITDKNGKAGFIDRTGKVAIEPRFQQAEGFSEGLAGVEVDDQWGYIDKTGEFVIEPQFDYAAPFSEGLAAVRFPDPLSDDYKWGYINGAGDLVIKPQFESARIFSEGLAAVEMGDWGYIDKTGSVVAEPQWDNVGDFSEGLAAIQPAVFGEMGYIDKTGKIVIEPQFLGEAGDFTEGLALVNLNPMRGYIDRTGKVLVETDFSSTGLFSEGLTPVGTGLILEEVWGYMDKTGKLVIKPKFDSAASFSEGLAAVKVNGKWGYIDKTGEYVIEPKFDVTDGGSANYFSEGLAWVQVGDKEGYIDKTGRWVWSK